MEKLKWETKKVKVKDLKQLDINPRKITDNKKTALINSLNTFNLVEIPAVNTDNVIIGGNQRVLALVLAGREEELIDVRYPNRMLTDLEVKQYAIISNTHAGEFDFEIINDSFSDIDLSSIEFDIAGLDDWLKEQEKILKNKSVDDDYVVPEGGVDLDINEGDLIQIGDHRLICGSSTVSDVWQKLLGDERCDLVVTDPPYNVAYEGKTKDALTIKNDNMSNSEFYQFLYDFFISLGLYVKSGAAWYVWHADREGANFINAMTNAGIMVKQCLVWVKNTMVMGRQDYQYKHEPCLYGWKHGSAHTWYSDRKQTTVLNFDKPLRNAEHPTMKPVELISYQISNSSKCGDLVADAFGGSGTTMVACHQMNRVCRMVELDPKYCGVIVQRMVALDPSLLITKNGIKWDIQKNS